MGSLPSVFVCKSLLVVSDDSRLCGGCKLGTRYWATQIDSEGTWDKRGDGVLDVSSKPLSDPHSQSLRSTMAYYWSPFPEHSPLTWREHTISLQGDGDVGGI